MFRSRMPMALPLTSVYMANVCMFDGHFILGFRRRTNRNSNIVEAQLNGVPSSMSIWDDDRAVRTKVTNEEAEDGEGETRSKKTKKEEEFFLYQRMSERNTYTADTFRGDPESNHKRLTI
ncbi:hypothetical protein BLOT_007632 [Blomia tropicalis]|nr:hypothetical protein BLOT_007632 [Blomia tropicalis]